MSSYDLKVGPFIGVDVSSAMLAQADAKQLYAELRKDDIIAFLHEDARRWPLIVAADALCHFGTLDQLLGAVRCRLVAGGWFLFSIELLVPDLQGMTYGNGDWALGRQGRYAHAEDYVVREAAAAGYVIRSVSREILRFEADAPVEGLLVVLERPYDDN